MSRAQFFERERTEDIEDRRYACSCIVVCLILYFIMFIIDNSLWHSYVKSSCFVVNSTIVERQCCLQYQSNSVFEAVWVLNVHPNGSHSTQYLADIRQKFDNYYEAYEAILTLNLTGSQQQCYVHSKDKFDIRWTSSSTEGIVSALFGFGTLLFIIIIVSCVQTNK